MKTLNSISALFLVIMSWLFSVESSAQTTLTISDPDSVCVGEVPTYTLSPTILGLNYTWTVSSEGNLLSEGNSAVIQWTTVGNASISVQGTDTTGTIIAQGSLNVTVNSIPTPLIVPQGSVSCIADTLNHGLSTCIKACENSTIGYAVENVPPGATVSWSIEGEENFFSFGLTCYVIWGDAGNGSVSVEVQSGACIGSNEICIDIIEGPNAGMTTVPSPNAQTIDACLNSSILFFDNSTYLDDSPIVSWVWDFDDGTFESAGIGSSMNPVEHSFSQSGLYDVVLTVTNECGCTDSDTITVDVSQYEGIQIECPGMVCDGDQATYTVDNPNCPLSNWIVTGGQIVSQNSQSVTVNWNSVDENGFGYVTYNNACNPCPGKTMVKVPVITENIAIQGPTSVCPNQVYYYSIPQWPSSKFDSDVTGDAQNLSSYPTNVITILTEDEGSFTITATACTGTLDCGADTSLTVNITPAAFIVGSENVCLDDDSEYTLENVSSADWTLTDPASATTIFTDEASIEPNFNQPGNYTLEISGDFCSPEIFHITVHPKPQPPILLGPDSTCIGVPTGFTLANQQPGVTYTWGTIYGTASPVNGPNTNFTFTQLPSQIAVISELLNVPGCSVMVIDTIHPISPSSVNISTNAPPDLEICGSTQWVFEVDYTDGDFYHWEILDPTMGSIVSGNNTPSIEVLFNNPTGISEDVDVIVSMTKCNEVLEDTLTMHVINLPVYTATPGDTTICAGEELTFTISPTPDTYSSLEWDFGDGELSGVLNPTYSYPNNTATAEFYPTVSIENPEGCVSTAVVIAGPVEVVPAPVALVSPTGNIIFCDSVSELLSATISTGFGSTTNYTWYGGNNPPDCSTCTTHTITGSGTYYVEVENSNGCSALSNEVYVFENCDNCPGPKPYLVASDSTFVDCGEVTATIQYNANGQDISNETWVYPPEATLITSDTGTNASTTVSFTEAGVYTLTYVVSYGDSSCTKEFNQSVYVPFIGDMKFSASCGSGNTYDVTLFDHSNIFPLEQGFMEHEYAYMEAGDPDWTIISPSSALSVNLNLQAGVYDFREIISSTESSAPPCTTLISNVVLPEKPDADFDIISPFIPACVNDVVVQFDNQSTPTSGLSYLWDFGEGPTNYQPSPGKVYTDPDEQLITLTATNAFGCVDSAESSIQIQENGLWDGVNNPTLLTSPTPPVCTGDLISLTYFSTFTTPSNFIWYQGNNAITPSVTSAIIDVTQSGVYWAMGSDEYGCLVPTAPTQINFTPVVTPSIIGNPEQCDSTGFSLTSSITNSFGIDLQWERTPGGVVGTGNSITEVLPSGTYTYVLTATQNQCVGESVPFTVTVSDPVSAPILDYDITDCEEYTVELSITNPQSGTYTWNHGVEGTSVDASYGGLFEVDFTSNNGCTSSSSIIVPSSPQEYMWHFPTGCFCLEELVDQGNNACTSTFGVTGMYLPFASWSYLVNGEVVLSGTNSEPLPLPFSTFDPDSLSTDSVNLVLDNGFCEVTSGTMYISSCQQGISIGETNPGLLYSDNSSKLEQGNADTEFQSEPMIRLMPNPANNQTLIQFQFNTWEAERFIEVYDLTGRKVMSFLAQNHSGQIDLHLGDFVNGIYQVCLREGGNIVAQSKLSVMH